MFCGVCNLQSSELCPKHTMDTNGLCVYMFMVVVFCSNASNARCADILMFIVFEVYIFSDLFFFEG